MNNMASIEDIVTSALELDGRHIMYRVYAVFVLKNNHLTSVW